VKRLRTLAPLLLLLVGVAAGCTGTSENIPPLLLALGRQDPTNSSGYQMVLLEDNFPNQPRFSVVTGSEQPLPYPAVASDVVDRAGTRSAMVVLTRELTGNSPASSLVEFQLAGIDPATPSDFHETLRLQLTGGTSPVFGGSSGPWCFSHVTVSRDGRYVYLIDDPNACSSSPTSGTPGLSVPIRLYQVDTQTSGGDPTEIVQSPIQPTAPLDDQATTGETLYFLVNSINNAQLYSVPVPYLPSQDSPATIGTTFPGYDQLALRSNGSDLVTVTNSSPYGPPTDYSSNLESLTLPLSNVASTVKTVNGARTLALDPTGFTQSVAVAGYNQIAAHSSPTDKAPSETVSSDDVTGVAAAVDPSNNFGYVVDNGRIVLLDLITAESPSQRWYWTYPSAQYPNPSADQLQLPKDAGGRYVTALAWARSKIPIP